MTEEALRQQGYQFLGTHHHSSGDFEYYQHPSDLNVYQLIKAPNACFPPGSLVWMCSLAAWEQTLHHLVDPNH